MLICTTLVTNVGNTSIVTNDCREAPAPIVMKVPVENKTTTIMQPPPALKSGTVVGQSFDRATVEVQPANTVDLQAMAAATDAVSPILAPKPVFATDAKPKRVKAQKQSQSRKLRKAPRRAMAIREANGIPRPAIQQRQTRKLTAWEKLQGILIGRPRT